MIKMPEFKNIEEMQSFLDKEDKAGGIVITPSDLTPVSYYRPVIERVILQPDDIYNAQKKVRIRYTGLTKLGNAAGVEWIPDETCRTDNRSDKMYVAFRAVGGVRKNDGRLYTVKAEYDLDLEIIEEEIRDSYLNKRNDKYNKNKTDEEFSQYVEYCTRRDVIQKRKRKLTLAESGAKARVLRAVLGIKSQYDDERQVVNTPFYVVRFILDHNNKDIKRLFLRAAERSMCIYGGLSETRALPVPESNYDTIDIIPEPDQDFEQEPPDDRELFISYDIQTQANVLCELSAKVGYDMDSFLKQSKIDSPERLSEKRRIEFYDFLTERD